jgi:hypothetical protein
VQGLLFISGVWAINTMLRNNGNIHFCPSRWNYSNLSKLLQQD